MLGRAGVAGEVSSACLAGLFVATSCHRMWPSEMCPIEAQKVWYETARVRSCVCMSFMSEA